MIVIVMIPIIVIVVIHVAVIPVTAVLVIMVVNAAETTTAITDCQRANQYPAIKNAST